MTATWLDPQTRELLEPSPPRGRAPARASEFGLVLIAPGQDRRRLLRAVRRIHRCSAEEASRILKGRVPRTIHADLSHEEALLGQFELVCCDAVSVFLPSHVLAGALPAYLRDLYARLARSPEFETVPVRMENVPSTEAGLRFLDQFLGWGADEANRRAPVAHLSAMRKKARIMAHWARRVGARVITAS